MRPSDADLTMATDEDDLDLQDVPEDYVAEDERNGESGNRVRSPLEMADPHEPEREPILIDTTGLAPENYYLLQSLVNDLLFFPGRAA